MLKQTIHTPILILAAGESKRLGQPKQLLEWKNKTLLQHAILKASAIKNTKIFVVLGAYKDLIQPTIVSHNIHIIENSSWKEGMGTSLSVGIKYILDVLPDAENILITLSDLPLLESKHLSNLLEKFNQSDKNIAITQYDDIRGIPSIFSKKYFRQLIAVDGEKGAKKIIQKNKDDIIAVLSTVPYFDIDTMEAYNQLLMM